MLWTLVGQNVSSDFVIVPTTIWPLSQICLSVGSKHLNCIITVYIVALRPFFYIALLVHRNSLLLIFEVADTTDKISVRNLHNFISLL